jgi:Protein of unknown function (DUF2971)
MEKWKRQFIRLLFHYSRHRSSPGAADLVKDPHVPSALYKFRRFCDRHKKALEQDVLWRTSPSQFNDPYDSVIYFDIRRFFMEDFSFADLMNAVAESKAGGKFEPKPLKKPIHQREWHKKFLEGLLKDQPKEVAEACLNWSDENTRRLQEETVRAMSNTIREGYSVICFAGTATSVLMWSHYSQDVKGIGHRGFCIEYNLTGTEWGRLCYPVLYRKKLTDATRYMFKKDPKDFNNLFCIYACILKSDEWCYEQEWRIVLPVGAPYANDRVRMPKPSAIILGALAKPDDAEWMKQFCQNHSIPLRKMVQHLREFRLEITDF